MPRKYTSNQIVDVHDIHPVDMLKGEVEEIHEEISKLFRSKCPFIRVMVPKRGKSRV